MAPRFSQSTADHRAIPRTAPSIARKAGRLASAPPAIQRCPSRPACCSRSTCATRHPQRIAREPDHHPLNKQTNNHHPGRMRSVPWDCSFCRHDFGLLKFPPIRSRSLAKTKLSHGPAHLRRTTRAKLHRAVSEAPFVQLLGNRAHDHPTAGQNATDTGRILTVGLGAAFPCPVHGTLRSPFKTCPGSVA